MILSNGKDKVELTNEIQIAAFLNSGYKEVKPKQNKKAETENGTETKA